MDEPDSTSEALNAITAAVPPEAQDRLKTDASAIAGEAQQTFQAIQQEATDQATALKDQAQDQIAEATDKAKSFAAEQKDVAGNKLGGIAEAISKVANELQDSDQPVVAGYARDLAGGIRNVSEGVKSRNVDELIAMAEDFGRKQPLAFLGAAALAGFVASRFVLASAQRRSNGAATPASQQAGTAGPDTASSILPSEPKGRDL